jgi:hypothetical protein
MKLPGKFILSIIIVFVHATGSLASDSPPQEGTLKIGWAAADITPTKPVLIAGQFHARLSEGVMDPIAATALAIESTKGGSSVGAIMISCDYVSISDGLRGRANLRDRVRQLLKDLSPNIKQEDIMINATHTHAAPLLSSESDVEKIYGVSLKMMAPGVDVMSPAEYSEFAALRIADAARKAWTNRKKGGISFGLSTALIGHNRLQAENSGKSVMYGSTNRPDFSHIEGYEDHYVNLLYTWDDKSKLTGVVINVAVPSQVSEHSYLISADFWHDTRVKAHETLGKDVYILPQASAAGDQSPHLMWGSKAEERMQMLMGLDKADSGRGSISQRKQIAIRIVDAVTSILPYMKQNIEWNPSVAHTMKNVELSRRLLGQQDLDDAHAEIHKWQKEYDRLLTDVKANPQKMKTPRWYKEISISFSKLHRGKSVLERYELEKVQPKLAVEVHVLRIGDIAFATNPFELYVDYGVRIKARSPATQTFLVQLTGSGTYLPTKRSIAGGAYGAVPASTIFGPEGGQELVEETLKMIDSMWEKDE